MPWTPPSDPVTSTVITVAYAVANLLTQIRWLRNMTGGADPPATNYVVVSDSTSTTSWRKVPADALAAGAVTTQLGYVPANKAGEDFTGAITVPPLSMVKKFDDSGAGGRLVLQASSGQQSASLDVFNNLFRLFDSADGVPLLSFNLTNGDLVLPSQLVLAPLSSSATGRVLAQAAAGTPGYIMDMSASTWRVFNPADSSRILTFDFASNLLVAGGFVVITSATIGAQSVAFATNATNAGNANTVGGRTPSTVPSASGIPVADSAGKIAAGWLPAASGGDAPSVTGHVPTATPAPGALPLANASGKLDDWVTPSVAGATVPSGLIAIWDTGTPPSGWSFMTSFTGRFVIAATPTGGTTLGATGGVNDHTHTTNIAHGHADTFSFGGAVGADGSAQVKVTVVTPGDANAATSGHGHGFSPSQSGGVTALANPTTITSGGATNHMPPFIALNYVKKS